MTTRASCTTPTSPHFRRISPSALRAAWLDPDRRVKDIAAEVNLSPRALRVRVRAIGLDVRSLATKKPSISTDQEALFCLAWRAGVGLQDMAAHFGVSARTVANTRCRLCLPGRINGTKPRTTMAHLLASVRERELAGQMARAAQLEQAAMINAELVDRVADNNWVGIKHARGLM